jgi:putative sigma-54 modulation protein
LDTPIEGHIVLSVEKFRHQADVTLNINGVRIKGVEETGDMYSAIDQVMDKIEQQLKRHLGRIKDRRVENRKETTGLPGEGLEDTSPLPQEEAAIVVERLVAKPMDPEESAMQLQMSNLDFLVFRNARSMEINVIYRRKDGNLGLIEPAA